MSLKNENGLHNDVELSQSSTPELPKEEIFKLVEGNNDYHVAQKESLTLNEETIQKVQEKFSSVSVGEEVMDMMEDAVVNEAQKESAKAVDQEVTEESAVASPETDVTEQEVAENAAHQQSEENVGDQLQPQLETPADLTNTQDANVCNIPHIKNFDTEVDQTEELEEPSVDQITEVDPTYTEVTVALTQHLYDVLDTQLYTHFRQVTVSVKEKLTALLTEEASNMWIKSINQSEEQMLKQHPQIQLIVQGERKLVIPDDLRKFCDNELQKLQPIESSQFDALEQKVIHLTKSVDDYETVANEVVELTEMLRSSKHQTEKLLETLEQRTKQSLQMMIKAVDLLDLIRNAAQNDPNNATWIEQIDEAIAQYLVHLRDFDVEEIQALGELLDGKYMISLGTVPPNTVASYAEKFQVCVVHERGFKKISTGEVIREAKVINVY